MPIGAPLVKMRFEHCQLISHASLGAFPQEACGILLGHIFEGARVVEDILIARNCAEDPAHFFEIDPSDLIRAHKRAREVGQHVLGHFHSHPNGAREPSAHDAAMAEELGQIWLIQAIQDGDALPVTAFLTVRNKNQGWPFIALEIAESQP